MTCFQPAMSSGSALKARNRWNNYYLSAIDTGVETWFNRRDAAIRQQMKPGGQQMSRAMLKRIVGKTADGQVVKIHRLVDSDEFRVGYYDTSGKRIADSFHSDMCDAIGTAKFEIERSIQRQLLADVSKTCH